jgi:hypothetical protein
MADTRTNVEKIKSIFFDYAQGINWLEISVDELDIIAKRIEIEVIGIQDDNEFVSLKDLTKDTGAGFQGENQGDGLSGFRG